MRVFPDPSHGPAPPRSDLATGEAIGVSALPSPGQQLLAYRVQTLILIGVLAGMGTVTLSAAGFVVVLLITAGTFTIGPLSWETTTVTDIWVPKLRARITTGWSPALPEGRSRKPLATRLAGIALPATLTNSDRGLVGLEVSGQHRAVAECLGPDWLG